MSNQGSFKYQNNLDNQNQLGESSLNQQEPPLNQPDNVKLLQKQKKEGDHSHSPQTKTNTMRGKLIDQHSKLKSQLKELAAKMDEIVEKEKQRKKKKHVLNQVQEDQRVAQLKKQLKDQEIRIQRNKNEIARLRRNLDNKYDINKITEKQNELKHLKKQLQSLEEEKDALEKIRKTQDKAIKNGEDRETTDKIAKMEEELKQLTHKTKKQTQSINEKQKQIRKLHEAYITKQERIREIQAKTKDKKSHGEDVNEYTIGQLQDEIKALEQERLQVEKQGNQRVRALQRERKELKHELQRKKLILDQKQKELRLNQMKHKEIVRLINSNPGQQHKEKEKDNINKGQGKRMLGRKGRQAPKFQNNDDVIDDN